MAKAPTLKIAGPAPAVDEGFETYDVVTSKAARITIVIEGIKPLLTHNPQNLGADSDDAKRGTRVPKPEDEAEAGCYRNAEGVCCIPGDAPRKVAIDAGASWKATGRKTMKSILAHIVVVEDLVPLFRPNGEPITDYRIDRHPVKVGQARVMRSRPCFDEWCAKFTIEYDPMLIKQPKQIVDVVADGGSRLGIGDYRPKFGRYKVRSFKIED